jgi:hypothetical protein
MCNLDVDDLPGELNARTDARNTSVSSPRMWPAATSPTHVETDRPRLVAPWARGL